jgi:predicted O-methyltransferase YrrM
MQPFESGSSPEDVKPLQDRLDALEQRVVDAINTGYRQTEALVMLSRCLPLRYPLPRMRSWAVSPDLALSLYEIVRERQPEWIIECGSGVSSIVMGYALREIGRGRLIAFEHLERFVDTGTDLVSRHELSEHVEIVHAPLEPVELGGASWQWYGKNVHSVLEGKKADLLFVDGPPGGTGPLARYPALPVLKAYLSPDVLVVLDDAERSDEREILERWLKEHPEFSSQYLRHEKGTALLSRSS